MTNRTDRQHGDISGVYNDPARVAEVLDIAADNYNLIGSIVFGEIPIGHALVMSVVRIDPRETYPTTGGNALSSVALNKLAGAAGVHIVQSVCTEKARNVCTYQATIRRQELDGGVRTMTQSYTLDLRDGSSRILSIEAKARSKNKSAEADIREKRAAIAQLAETGAYHRALRKLLGLRVYTPAELGRPFAVPKLQFTGRAKDPALAMRFAEKIADAALGVGTMLYSAPQLPPAPLAAPGPMAHSLDEEDGHGETVGEAMPYEQAVARASRRPSEPPPAARGSDRGGPAPRTTQGSKAPHVMSFGKAKGTPIDQASDDDLGWYRGAVARSIDDPAKARFREANVAVLRECDAELRRRNGEVEDPDPGDYDGNGEGHDEYGRPL